MGKAGSKGRGEATHSPHRAARSPEDRTIQGSAPVAAPARGLKARESAAPLANGLVRAPSFQDHASHTATRLSSPVVHMLFSMPKY